MSAVVSSRVQQASSDTAPGMVSSEGGLTFGHASSGIQGASLRRICWNAQWNGVARYIAMGCTQRWAQRSHSLRVAYLIFDRSISPATHLRDSSLVQPLVNLRKTRKLLQYVVVSTTMCLMLTRIILPEGDELHQTRAEGLETPRRRSQFFFYWKRPSSG